MVARAHELADEPAARPDSFPGHPDGLPGRPGRLGLAQRQGAVVSHAPAYVWQGHWEILGVWLVIFLLWVLRFYGGGDAKVLMFLFALFPTERLLYVLLAMALVVGLPLLWRKYREQNLVLLAQRAAFRLASGDMSPSDEEWSQARPYTWLLALSGIVCLWVYGI
jgi:hypothetical protein